MSTINITEKLRQKIKKESSSAFEVSESFFGQWCANIFYSGHFQYLLITNERTLLSVVIPAKELKVLDSVFPKYVEDVLQRIGIPIHKIENVINGIKPIRYARQTKRQVLGSMNDLIKLAKYFWENEPSGTINELVDYLNNVPCSPIKMNSPKSETILAFNKLTI